MKIKYFTDTDTRHIELRAADIVATRDPDENTVLDVDAQGGIRAITVEHASACAEIPQCSHEPIAA